MKKIALCAASIAAAFFLAGCGGGDDDKPPVINVATYRVQGAASKALVTYQSASGATSQELVTLPWEKSIIAAGKGDFLYVSAQSQSSSGLSITVTISANGMVLKQSTSNAPFGIASASATCCS
jgi:hypothetical protein